MNKILIATPNRYEAESLENILQEIVETGGELLFATSKEGIEKLKEEPTLVFIDSKLKQELKRTFKCPVVLLADRGERVEGIIRPVKASHVLEKCHLYLKMEKGILPKEM